MTNILTTRFEHNPTCLKSGRKDWANLGLASQSEFGLKDTRGEVDGGRMTDEIIGKKGERIGVKEVWLNLIGFNRGSLINVFFAKTTAASLPALCVSLQQ